MLFNIIFVIDVEIIYRFYCWKYVWVFWKRVYNFWWVEGMFRRDKVIIDKVVLRDYCRWKIYFVMVYVDCFKVYDMILYSWIVECLDIFEIDYYVRKF